MLRKLRLKFVVINMATVTAMLCVIFGLVYHFTRVDLEQENLTMMRAIAAFPALDRPGRPDELPEEVRLPYFTLEIGADGAVSAFGAASVLGVPFALAFLSGDTVVNIAGLSALASLGDMMPPTALAGLFAAQVTGVEKYSRVLKRCLIPCIIIMVWAAVVIFFSDTIGAWF